MSKLYQKEDTIVALATPAGTGAIGVIRLSGKQAIAMADQVFSGKSLSKQKSHTIHHGWIKDEDEILDEVLVSLFKGPTSYTKEDVVEISCHGSVYVIKSIIRLLISKGARLAKAGEFTQRAFLHGQMDLVQAEAVADLIASESAAAHQAAVNQMRGGISKEIRRLREELIHFASMIELELDFSEEDVEFASRDDLKKLVNNLLAVIAPLIESFQWGNAIKNGIPTVIAGRPNVGKSTLLNALLNEEKAIVSEIPGTTRDFIEDEMVLEGIPFRFIDTAGLRDTEDTIEALGIARTKEKMEQASLILYLFDLSQTTQEEIDADREQLKELRIPFLQIGNKKDLAPDDLLDRFENRKEVMLISALKKENLDQLKARLLEVVQPDDFKTGETMVTNLRHFQSLQATKKALDDVIAALDKGRTGDLLALDIRQALHHLGEITGEITTEDLLDNIFSKFCIGK